VAKTLEKRVAELEHRVARIENNQLIEDRRTSEEGRGKTDSSFLRRNAADISLESDGDESLKIKAAESLFVRLLGEKSLISYSEAYQNIVGPYAVWRNAVHAPEIIRIACKTPQYSVGKLTIRLDALIVGKQTRRPARGHFANAEYSEVDWIQTFGTWPLHVIK
jgi:hypothetical protein